MFGVTHLSSQSSSLSYDDAIRILHNYQRQTLKFKGISQRTGRAVISGTLYGSKTMPLDSPMEMTAFVPLTHQFFLTDGVILTL